MNTQTENTTPKSIAQILSDGLNIPLAEIPSRYRSNDKAILAGLETLRETHPKKVARWEESLLSGMEKPVPVAVAIEPEATEPEAVKAEPLTAPKAPSLIFGQPGASLLIQGAINSYKSTGRFKNAYLVFGPAGVGKSHTMDKFADLFESAGANVIKIRVASQIARKDEGGFADKIRQAMADSASGLQTVVLIDEAHKIPLDKSPAGRMMDSILLAAGQGWAIRGEFEWSGKIIPYDAANITFILGTNFPKKVMKGNANASNRRFVTIELERYSGIDIKKIIPLYFQGKQVKIQPCAVKDLMKIHRGTLEALDDVFKKLDGQYDSEQGVDKESLDKVLPYCQFNLRGFRKEEISALKWLASDKEPPTEKNMGDNFPGLDIGEFYRHAKRQEALDKSGNTKETPFLLKLSGNRYGITDVAKAFLNKHAKAFAEL